MGSAELAPLLAFRTALSQLESHLSEGRWQEAGEAGQALADACERCQSAGIRLSPSALTDAKTLFERCVTLTARWQTQLHIDARRASSSARALHSYNQG